MSSFLTFLQRIATVCTILLTVQPIVNSGFTDTTGPLNVDHVLTGVRTPRMNDNTSVASSTKNDKRQAFIPATYTNHLSALANMANFGGFGPAGAMGSLRTVMMGGMLYGLSLIPAVVLALGGNGLPVGGILSSLGLSKRAVPETSSAKMPLLSETQTKRLLHMLQSAFKQWSIADEDCKQLFVCQMYRQVSSNGVSPDLELFKEALLHILE